MCVMDSLIQTEISFQRKILGFQLKLNYFWVGLTSLMGLKKENDWNHYEIVQYLTLNCFLNNFSQAELNNIKNEFRKNPF